MKKVYTKPDLYCESFMLTASIAGVVCDNPIGHTEADTTCRLDLTDDILPGAQGKTLFSSKQNCDLTYGDNAVFYCEFTATENMLQLFNS